MLKVDLPAYQIQNKQILSRIKLQLNKGENLTILGSNGAGKSTLAKLLCGLLPSKKAIMIEENPLESYTPSQRANLINYVPPVLEHYEEYLLVEDFLGLLRFKQTAKETIMIDALERFGILHLRHSDLSGLSSGEKQLVQLSAALLHHAKITIFDEPTSNLDPKKTKQLFEVLTSDLFSSSIVITHDLHFAQKLDYPICYLHEGEMSYFGTAEEFFTSKNLKAYFDDSVTLVGGNVVVNL